MGTVETRQLNKDTRDKAKESKDKSKMVIERANLTLHWARDTLALNKYEELRRIRYKERLAKKIDSEFLGHHGIALTEIYIVIAIQLLSEGL